MRERPASPGMAGQGSRSTIYALPSAAADLGRARSDLRISGRLQPPLRSSESQSAIFYSPGSRYRFTPPHTSICRRRATASAASSALAYVPRHSRRPFTLISALKRPIIRPSRPLCSATHSKPVDDLAVVASSSPRRPPGATPLERRADRLLAVPAAAEAAVGVRPARRVAPARVRQRRLLGARERPKMLAFSSDADAGAEARRAFHADAEVAGSAACARQLQTLRRCGRWIASSAESECAPRYS